MIPAAQFRADLFAHGLLIPTGVDGLYARSGLYERVVEGLDGLITRQGAFAAPEVLRFPPGMSRAVFERSGYMKGFPNLAGTVHSFCGDDHGHQRLLQCIGAGEDFASGQTMTDIVLTPAACYPAYPMIAARGPIAAGGLTLDVQSYCFRHEPSIDPGRLQMFRMREYVRIGAPADVLAFRDSWMIRLRALASQLGLLAEVDVANDPFFGRGGRMMAVSQREQALKFELLIPVATPDQPTACGSFNYHGDHFAAMWGLRAQNGTPVHTACVGFGMERLTLALFSRLGFVPAAWPDDVQSLLWGADGAVSAILQPQVAAAAD